MKISILYIKNHPFSGFVLGELRKKFIISSIIFDQKNFNNKDQSLWNERTNRKIKNYDEKFNEIKKN